SVIEIPRTPQEIEAEQKAREEGDRLLKSGKVAVLIVAGGQGSRLGFDGPKGVYPISPIKKKSLFQLFAEQLKARSVRAGSQIPLLVMTSSENHRDTVEFFQAHNSFGLGQNTFFFRQEMLPAISPQGHLVLENESGLFTNPNGHGGSLKSLYQSGLVNKLMEKGITHLFYCQVDNPLVKIADPVFLGYHTLNHSEASTKVVRRRNVSEKVGVYLHQADRDIIMEYSDLAAEDMSAIDDQGNVLYWAGNTAIHIFSLAFIRRINERGFALPYHCARKRVDRTPAGGESETLDVWKFETFVFDAIPLAERACCMEIVREQEFAPVKNSEGSDTPQMARQAMEDLFRSWLEKAGCKVAAGAHVEISPLFALDQEECVRKLGDKPMTFEGDVYIE
ncbi:MAG TPA: UTP--glucose-1-phosphate uridylyltransferase, partial [Syntrophorhabdaceae bacterium]|nr:UTP--glucose-1-phosphate uridylyltransferase [Syntrophorhabdaceae bacterium]